jgi:hypothetical protein
MLKKNAPVKHTMMNLSVAENVPYKATIPNSRIVLKISGCFVVEPANIRDNTYIAEGNLGDILIVSLILSLWRQQGSRQEVTKNITRAEKCHYYSGTEVLISKKGCFGKSLTVEGDFYRIFDVAEQNYAL